MQILYDNLNISFTIDHTAFSILNIALERLTRPIPAHSHGENCYEVHYISQGFGLLKNDTCVYDIGPDTLYLTGPNIIHEQTSIPSDPMIEYSVYFHMTCPSEKPVFFTPLKNIPFWICQGNKDMHPIFKKLFEELQTQNEGYLLLAASLLQLCICMLVRKCAHTVTPPPKKSDFRYPSINLSDKRNFITEKAFLFEYKTLTLDRLADYLGLSLRQTERFLKQHYNQTFSQKRTAARMSAAAVLLKNPDQTLLDIANQLGYSSVEYFSQVFKRSYHLSPYEYRTYISSSSDR